MRRFTPVALALFGVFSLAAVNLQSPNTAYAVTSDTVNFQARLKTDTGAIVPDGTYNIEFKLYDASTSSGSSQGSCSGDSDCLWVESRTSGNKVTVTSGYFNVQLGSVTGFPSTIDWSQKLWLTMNIGGTSSPSWDGEMNPRLALTATPYAFQAAKAASADQVIKISGGNTSTLSIQAPTGGSQTFVLQDQGAGGTYNLLTAPSGSDGYIKLQGSSPSQQTGYFNISGTGIAASLQSAAILSTNGSNSNTVTISSGTTTSSYTLQLPTGIGTAGQCLVISSVASTTAALGWNDCSGADSILQGGNSFGADMAIGTDDAYGLSLKTNDLTRLSLAADGAATLQNSADTALTINADSSETTTRTLLLQQQGTADSSIEFQDANGKSYFMGMDQSAGGIFRISSSTSASTVTHVGNDVSGGSPITGYGNTAIMYKVTTGGSGGTATAVAVDIDAVDASYPGMKAALYADNAGAPGALLGTSGASTLTTGLNMISISVPVSASTDYWIALNPEGDGTYINTTYNAPSANTGYVYAKSYASAWADPAGTPYSGPHNDHDITTYLLVTPSGAVDAFEGTNLLSVTDTGSVSLQNSEDSNVAFRVLNAAGVPAFTVDTSNSLVYVGDPTADSTGALLILDTKNTSGDPTGIPGAMYYNSYLGISRCYVDSYWRDCVQDARTSYDYTNEFMKSSGDKEDIFISNGNTESSVAGHPGIISLGGNNNGDQGMVASGFGSGYNSVLLGDGATSWRTEMVTRVHGATLSQNGSGEYVFVSGFLDEGDYGDGVISNISNGCYFLYTDTVNSGKWQAICESGDTQTTCDTGITVDDTDWYRLTVVVNAAGTAANFLINGTNVCTVTSNIPTTALSYGAIINKLDDTSYRGMDLDYISAQAQFSAPR